MERFGPLYCETPETITGVFPVEPANAISSGVIVLFGIAALVLVMRREPRAIVLYVACALLMLNGVGSILWHGLRTRWALTLDFMPALIFLLIVAFLWARRHKSPRLWAEYLMLAGVGRFAVEFLRVNPRVVLGMSEAQIISLSLFAVGAVSWLHARRSFVPATA